MLETLPSITLPEVIVPVLSLSGVLIGAVSSSVRHKVLANAGGTCQSKSPTPHEGILEAAHKNHSRKDILMHVAGLLQVVPYDDPRRCQALCTRHHLEDHISNAGHNGLCNAANNWAIKAIKRRLEDLRDRDVQRDEIERPVPK
jgi:hypothetical protein